MMINRSAAMALFLPLLLVLLLVTVGGQASADEPSTSQRAVPESPAPKGSESMKGPPASTGGAGHGRHREIKIGPCIPSRSDGNNALSNDVRGNAVATSCLKPCMSKGYAGGRCDLAPDGFPGNCFCVTLDGRA